MKRVIVLFILLVVVAFGLILLQAKRGAVPEALPPIQPVFPQDDTTGRGGAGWSAPSVGTGGDSVESMPQGAPIIDSGESAITVAPGSIDAITFDIENESEVEGNMIAEDAAAEDQSGELQNINNMDNFYDPNEF